MAGGTSGKPVEIDDAKETTTPCNAKGRKLSSKVWKAMTREILPGGEIRATCVYCKQAFNASSANGTSHLNRHMKKCALRFNYDIKNYCIAGSSSEKGDLSSMSLKNPTANLDEVRRAVCVYVVAGPHPFTTCEEPGFRFMASVMCPQYNNVSRHTHKRDAMRYYNEERKNIEYELQKAPGRICFTTDNWKSDHTHDEYMCITAHWVDSDWKLQNRIIKFSALTPPFDGNSLVDEITLCLGQWKITHKIFSFTVDNASYNDTMIDSLRSHFMRKKYLVYDGDFFHLRCSAHIINLIVQAGLNLIVTFIIEMYLIILWVRDNDIKVFQLSTEEWGKVNELNKFLKVFYDVTNSFSASKTPTANVYFDGVWKIQKKLIDISNGLPSLLTSMVNGMHEKFNKYWSDYNLVLSCAAVLDPRLKLERVEYCYEKLYGEVYAKEMIESIRNTLFELYDE
ncbi:hypothetical protein OROGR_004833 [Orobanche gracilis]